MLFGAASPKDQACKEAGLSPSECEAAVALVQGDFNKLREIAVTGVAKGAAGACAAYVHPATAPVCEAVARAAINWTINMFETMGAPTFHQPWTRGDCPESAYFFCARVTTMSELKAAFAYGFKKWPRAKAMLASRPRNERLGKGKRGAVLIYPARAWYKTTAPQQYIDSTLEQIGSSIDMFAYGQNRGGPIVNAPQSGPSDPTIWAGFHTTGATLPDILNNAVDIPKPTAPAAVFPIAQVLYPTGTVAVFDSTLNKYRLIMPAK